ncbi:bifunctional UDP-sugar hydrolase/5'-nucleotidase UshA [Shewanella sp. SR44-3]|uniref:bifunctional UDP-sugar hydrolase/5'-nucleotidase UshA n=1 Tax=Shewanella sp. SR44-3 TaxID=2760936 RepID=UPI0015FCADB0|nr:bifunctional UDP-sugar hydrolase/5'-nucleotidase UshA [Shewanella sp. SR44-3]MBB1268003.1 bifunctional UDP-sugar hydrolase/5'-nucleotidase [Shewanella sp. SR44-3]
MKNILIKGMVASAVLTALTGCGAEDSIAPVVEPIPVTCETATSCTKFTILHTNDNHGRFWQSEYGEYGMAARKTLIDSIRDELKAQGQEVLLLSGGDINTGVPESDMQDAVPDFLGMNLIGYDAMAVGNHEFDNDLDVVEMQRKLADFPFLAANIYDNVSGKRYFDAYKVFNIGGVRVAVVGLTTEDTMKIGNAEFIKGLTFTDPKEEIKKVIKDIKDTNVADLIIATTHMGHYADGASGSNAPGDVALARSLPAGDLAAVIGGHSQNPVCMEPGTNAYAEFNRGDACIPDQQNGTYIMQAHEWGKYVGRADFEYFDGKLNLASYKLIPVNLMVLNKYGTPETFDSNDKKSTRLIPGTTAIEENAGVLEVLRPYQEKGQALLDVKIGETDGELIGIKATVRYEQTNLGRLLARAQSKYKLVDADFGIMNSGGVRASIAAGDIAYRDVLTVQPFGNMVAYATMKGEALTTYMSQVATFTAGAGAYAQLDGIKMTVDCDAKTATINEIDGKVFDPAKEYKFSISSFLAAGGDGYPAIAATSIEIADALVLRDFIETQGTINVADFNPVAGDIDYQSAGVSVKACPAVPKS